MCPLKNLCICLPHELNVKHNQHESQKQIQKENIWFQIIDTNRKEETAQTYSHGEDCEQEGWWEDLYHGRHSDPWG